MTPRPANPLPPSFANGESRVARRSAAADRSRVARERAELAMTPGERLTLALELSDLCADLAAAGRLARERRP